jgi:DNA-binding MarR family transcriptional regulator
MKSAKVEWLDDEEMAAWRSFVDASTGVMADLETDLQTRHGISAGDYAVLVSLSETNDERRRMCDLASGLHLSPSGLTRRLDGLVRSGFVSREPSVEDRRVMLAVLTPEGRALLDRAAPDHVAAVRRHFLDHLSRTQIRNLAAALGSVERSRSAEQCAGGSGAA